MSAATALYQLTTGTLDLVVNSVTANNLAFTEVSVDKFQVNIETDLYNTVKFLNSAGTGTANIITSQLPIQMYDANDELAYELPIVTGAPGQVLALPQSGKTLEWVDSGSGSSGVNQITTDSNLIATPSTGNVNIQLAPSIAVQALAIGESALPAASAQYDNLFLGCQGGAFTWLNPAESGATVVENGVNTTARLVAPATYAVDVDTTLANMAEVDTVTLKLNGLTFPNPKQADNGNFLNYSTVDGLTWQPTSGTSIEAGNNLQFVPTTNILEVVPKPSFGDTTVTSLTIGSNPFPQPLPQDQGKFLGVNSQGVYALENAAAGGITQVTGTGNIQATTTDGAVTVSTLNTVAFGTLDGIQAGGVTTTSVETNTFVQSDGTNTVTYPSVTETIAASLNPNQVLSITAFGTDSVTLGWVSQGGSGGQGIESITSPLGTISVGQISGFNQPLDVNPVLYLEKVYVGAEGGSGGYEIPSPAFGTLGQVLTVGESGYTFTSNTGVSDVTATAPLASTQGTTPVISMVNNPILPGTVGMNDGTNQYSFVDPATTYAVPKGYILAVDNHIASTGPGVPYETILTWVEPQTASLPPYTTDNEGQVLTIYNDAPAWQEAKTIPSQFVSGNQVAATGSAGAVALNLSSTFYGHAAGLVTFDSIQDNDTTISKTDVMTVQTEITRINNYIVITFFTGIQTINTSGGAGVATFLQSRPTGQTNSFQDLLIAAGIGPQAGPIYLGQVYYHDTQYGSNGWIQVSLTGTTCYMQFVDTNGANPTPIQIGNSNGYVISFSETYDTVGQDTIKPTDVTFTFTQPPQ